MILSKFLLRLLAAQKIGREPLISYKLSLRYVGVYQAAGASWKMPSKFWEQDPLCLGRQPYFKLKILHRLGPSGYCKPWSSEMEPSHHFISLFKRVLFLAVVNQNVSWTKISPWLFFKLLWKFSNWTLPPSPLYFYVVIWHLFLTNYLKSTDEKSWQMSSE